MNSGRKKYFKGPPGAIAEAMLQACLQTTIIKHMKVFQNDLKNQKKKQANEERQNQWD